MSNQKFIFSLKMSKSKIYILIENVKIISLRNLFQHLLSAEILSEWKIEFILPYLGRNFKSMLGTN